MNMQTWDDLTTGATPLPVNDECIELARAQRDRETSAYSSICGADIADAPKYGLAAELYCLVGAGADPDAAWDYVTNAWLRYAAAQRDRVAAAGKISRGPSAGHSVISHRWVSDDLSWAAHVLVMISIMMDRHDAEANTKKKGTDA